VQDTEKYDKRITILVSKFIIIFAQESRFETVKDQVEKGFTSLKEFYTKKTDELNSKIEQF
jgi:hypothetical protein